MVLYVDMSRRQRGPWILRHVRCLLIALEPRLYYPARTSVRIASLMVFLQGNSSASVRSPTRVVRLRLRKIAPARALARLVVPLQTDSL